MPPRVLRCTECKADVLVYEASDTARTDADHQWLDAETFTCGSCAFTEAQDVPVPDSPDLAGLSPAEAQVARAKASGDDIPFMPEVAA